MDDPELAAYFSFKVFAILYGGDVNSISIRYLTKLRITCQMRILYQFYINKGCYRDLAVGGEILIEEQFR